MSYPSTRVRFEDNFIKVHIFLIDNGYIIVDKSDNQVIMNFFPSRIHQWEARIEKVHKKYIEELEKKNIEKLRRSLFFYEKKSTGIAHTVSLLSNYLLISENAKCTTIMPEYVSENIQKLVLMPFHKKVKILKEGIIYDCDRFFLSRYLDMMHPFSGNGTKIVTPTYQSRMYPLIYEQKCMEWFRCLINKYIDLYHHPRLRKKFDKIFVGKFEGQGKDVKNVQPPRTDYGFIDKQLLQRFELSGFKTIDPYKFHILDVIWYIRNCKELIISTGTAAHLYSPYVSKKTKVYYMINVIGENHVMPHGNNKNTHLTINNNEYMLHSMGIHWYKDYRICFYKSDPKWRGHNGRSDWELYDGEDMLDFLIDEEKIPNNFLFEK